MKIITVIGARPQFIKAAPVSRAIASTGEIEEIIVHTGQHFDDNMSRIFFDELQIPRPAYNLDINSLGHSAMTGRMMEKIEELLQHEQPDLLMVYGDTNSTLAGALAAAKMNIPVAHVEAGLRSFNMQMPEEINRIVTDRVSKLLFCPTSEAMRNLKNEGFENFDCHLFETGDVMYDAALYYTPFAKDAGLNLNGSFVLTTLHRAENTDNPNRLAGILNALQQISSETTIVLRLHPRTRIVIEKAGFKPLLEGIRTIDPVGYLEMIGLLKNCTMVMTDSGGLQKEAYFFGKPCITLRQETEWTELTREGVNLLAGSDTHEILAAYRTFSQKKTVFPDGLYGDGKASEKIAETLLRLSYL